MSVEKLVAAGAQHIMGRLYLNRVSMGSFEAEGFRYTEAGERWLAADAEASKAAEAPVEAPKPKRTKKTEVVLDEPDTGTTTMPDVDAMLGE